MEQPLAKVEELLQSNEKLLQQQQTTLISQMEGLLPELQGHSKVQEVRSSSHTLLHQEHEMSNLLGGTVIPRKYPDFRGTAKPLNMASDDAPQISLVVDHPAPPKDYSDHGRKFHSIPEVTCYLKPNCPKTKKKRKRRDVIEEKVEIGKLYHYLQNGSKKSKVRKHSGMIRRDSYNTDPVAAIPMVPSSLFGTPAYLPSRQVIYLNSIVMHQPGNPRFVSSHVGPYHSIRQKPFKAPLCLDALGREVHEHRNVINVPITDAFGFYCQRGRGRTTILRVELTSLKEQVEAQARDCSQRKLYIEELEEKESGRCKC